MIVPRRLHTHRIRIDTSFSFKVSEALLASLGQYATLGAKKIKKSMRFLNFFGGLFLFYFCFVVAVVFCFVFLFLLIFLYVHYMTTRVKSASSTQMRYDHWRRSVQFPRK